MANQLIVSNSLDSLAKTLSNKISQEKSVFRPIYVVTQTEGMNSWLKLQIAQQVGIAANIQFIKPNDLLNRVFQLLGGSFIQSISAHDLNWLLYKILAEKDFIETYPHIAAYYQENRLDQEIKRMALAEKVADLFDQYQVYRTEMIEAWNEEEDAHDNWQKTLWMRARTLAGEDFPDKTMVGNFIIENLENEERTALLRQRIPAVYFFGLSLITDYHLRIFHHLSQHIEVFFLMQNPAPHDYWYEDRSEKVIDFLKRKNIFSKEEESVSNPLLTTWGKLIQDTFMMLFQDEETLNQYATVGLVEPEDKRLLGAIQHSIFHNEKENIRFSPEQIQDGSIQINSCYSPVREVEVLYNYLVHLVDQKNESISSRDIVVMVADIDLYAAYIRAVFDNAPYQFRYTIADESYAVSDGISNTLLEILSLNENQMTAENVMRLLEFSSLRKQFQIQDVAFLRQLVADANIRFGIEGEVENDTHFVSWEYGMKRLMYGLCLLGEKELGSGPEGFYPLDQVEGFQRLEVIHLVYFVENLIASIQKRKKKRTISEWVQYVENTLTTFIGLGEEVQDEDYALLLNQLERYNLLEDLFEEKVSYEVFMHNFSSILSGNRKSGSFASGGITFCSLIPMRSIPFKVVALLGLNFDQFPRLDRRQSFDLMLQDKKRGDRNVKQNDKHLFLETVLSAQNYLYISYIGQSVKDNSTLPASVLVDELVDFISSNTENPEEVAKNFIQKHPLHGFSKRYNASDSNLYSYLLTANKENIDFYKKQETLALDFSEIEWNRMLSFFKDPIKAYYNRVLKVFYEEEALSLPETESFELDQLGRWHLKNELLHLDETAQLNYREKATKTGEFPLRNMGKVLLENEKEAMEYLKGEFMRLTEGKAESHIAVDLTLDGSRVLGKINGIYGNNLVTYSFSKNSNKYLLDTYLKYLMATAMGHELSAYFISNPEESVRKASSLRADEAQQILEEMVQLYKKGHQEILAFSPDWIKEMKLITVWNAEKILEKIESGFTNYKFSNTNPYHIKEREKGFFQTEEFMEEFQETAELLLLGMDELFLNEQNER